MAGVVPDPELALDNDRHSLTSPQIGDKPCCKRTGFENRSQLGDLGFPQTVGPPGSRRFLQGIAAAFAKIIGPAARRLAAHPELFGYSRLRPSPGKQNRCTHPSLLQPVAIAPPHRLRPHYNNIRPDKQIVTTLCETQ